MLKSQCNFLSRIVMPKLAQQAAWTKYRGHLYIISYMVHMSMKLFFVRSNHGVKKASDMGNSKSLQTGYRYRLFTLAL